MYIEKQKMYVIYDFVEKDKIKVLRFFSLCFATIVKDNNKT